MPVRCLPVAVLQTYWSWTYLVICSSCSWPALSRSSLSHPKAACPAALPVPRQPWVSTADSDIFTAVATMILALSEAPFSWTDRLAWGKSDLKYPWEPSSYHIIICAEVQDFLANSIGKTVIFAFHSAVWDVVHLDSNVLDVKTTKATLAINPCAWLRMSFNTWFDV